ncbi:putative serine protease PepD [Arcanobacterium phocae]|uniref:Putative serine protease PepD n=1 Tax=Arcanobacterium phocae TaxID=131112 RepID=A0A1H2LA76_9ACTO|nr:trypsin-like peptidase domain-containing protein [Arcanobacterium phocae]SDU77742.1 putative serine protease PepD [Arcanobacterium phocae]
MEENNVPRPEENHEHNPSGVPHVSEPMEQPLSGDMPYAGNDFEEVPAQPDPVPVTPVASASATAEPEPSAQSATNNWEQPMQWQPHSQYQPIFAPPTSFTQQKKQRRRPGWFALVAASVVAALAGAGMGIAGNSFIHPTGLRPATMTAAPQHNGGTTKLVNSTVAAPDWEKVADEVGATVVSLNVTTDGGQAQGSGVIIDKSGRILTNNHVVAGATKLFVMFSDGRVFEGHVMGTDEATDLAVVELVDPPKDLAVAQLGDSSDLNVGQAVAAIGNPMGLDSTLTTGVISALDRPTQADQGANVVTNAIQIDAAINPGNSGGPVFDQQGKVIGIASSIITVKTSFGGQGAGSIGLGFAIPVNLAKNISSQLIEKGSAEHAYLGVTITNGLAKFDDTRRTAATIKTVEPGTPAAKAGLKEDDNIVEVNGRKVSTATALTGYIRQYRSGDVVNVKIERGGKLMEVDVTLATRPDPRP